jgi:hypothetical protein
VIDPFAAFLFGFRRPFFARHREHIRHVERRGDYTNQVGRWN